MRLSVSGDGFLGIGSSASVLFKLIFDVDGAASIFSFVYGAPSMVPPLFHGNIEGTAVFFNIFGACPTNTITL